MWCDVSFSHGFLTGADFDGNGFVTGIDFDLYVNAFHAVCSSAAGLERRHEESEVQSFVKGVTVEIGGHAARLDDIARRLARGIYDCPMLAQALSRTQLVVAALGALFVVVGLAYLGAGFVYVVLAPRRERAAPGTCPSCGYTRNDASARCPECGYQGAGNPDEAERTQTRVQLGTADRWFTRGVCFCVLGFVIAVASSFT